MQNALTKIGFIVATLSMVSCADVKVDNCDGGSQGCYCIDGNCNLGLVCDDGICIDPSADSAADQDSACVPGTPGCTCTTDGKCQRGTVCRYDNEHRDAMCTEEAPCPSGRLGCGCYQDDTCDAGIDGAKTECRDGTCVAAACVTGHIGCTCDTTGGCLDDSVCINDICVANTGQTLQPPMAPACYTPCKTNLTDANGKVVVCSADGLAKGCFGNTACQDGSCRLLDDAGDTAPDDRQAGMTDSCYDDLDCPAHQNCIQNKCYSDCEVDADCNMGRTCSRKACKVPCTTTGNDCGDNEHCSVTGESGKGVCHPLGEASREDAMAPPPSFEIDTRSIIFTSDNGTGELLITNTGTVEQTVTVAKFSHEVITSEGTQVITINPLPWLQMGDEDDAPTLRTSISGEIAPGKTWRVLFDRGNNPDATPEEPAFVHWKGKLTVTPDAGNTREVTLEYSRKADGQWGGSAIYLANFGRAGLDDWMADKGNQDVVRTVGNALVLRWFALRQGEIDVQEFMAALGAIKTEAWKEPKIVNQCPSAAAPDPNVGCYPSLDPKGYSVFTNSLESAPIPSGVVELPFAMNLKETTSGGGTYLGGKILSDMALNYPGNPQVAIALDTSSEQCSVQTGNACLNYVNAFSADILVGGRYRTNVSDNGCIASGAKHYEQLQTPWLIPGFTQNTTRDSSTGDRYIYECRDKSLPNGDNADDHDDNMNAAGGNPVLDGSVRHRTIRLLDGALINRDTLFLLIEERFDSFLSPDDDAGFSSYGYILLERSSTTPNEDEYVGSGGTVSNQMDNQLGLTCSPSLVSQVLNRQTSTLSNANVSEFALAAISGLRKFDDLTLTEIDSAETVHYLCKSTGEFDGVCSLDEDPLFFVVQSDAHDNVVNHSCNFDGSCAPILSDWNANHTFGTWLNPYWECTTDVCDDDVNNRLYGKRFYQQAASTPLGDSGFESVHYLCKDMGTIDGYCPNGSEVLFFSIVDASGDALEKIEDCNAATSVVCNEGEPCAYNAVGDDQDYDMDLAAMGCTVGAPCPAKGSCNETVRTWRDANRYSFTDQIAWDCKQPGLTVCDSYRYDLRVEKNFYSTDSELYWSSPVNDRIADAFRYKVKFVNRQGLGIGFTPEICLDDDTGPSYCYDSGAIEELRQLVDCVTVIYTDYYDYLDTLAQQALKTFLVKAYAYSEEKSDYLPAPIVHDGFEKLNAELMVMLGDESFTRAFYSRFDLAETRSASFNGDLFETNGIRLSGGAGYEMHSLYQAVQYYQMALNRFFNQGPTIWKSLSTDVIPISERFITQATVVSYFTRLTKASTKKAQAWSEIAKKYQQFNRPELARQVIRREFTSTYLESITFSRMMQQIVEVSSREDRAQLEYTLDQAQRSYSIALRTMNQVFDEITDETSFFGIPVNEVSFPPLDDRDINAFEKRLTVALQKLKAAKDAEKRAIDDNRDFEVNGEVFKSELAALQVDYEVEMAEICGTFVGDDEEVYPAISEYRLKSAQTKVYGDPCGMVGNGALFDAINELKNARTEVDLIKDEKLQIDAEIATVSARAKAQCDRIEDFRDFRVSKGNTIISLKDAIASVNLAIAAASDTLDMIDSITDKIVCEPPGLFSIGSCSTSIGAAAAYTAAAATITVLKTAGRINETVLTHSINEIELDIETESILQECKGLAIDSAYDIELLLKKYPALELRASQIQNNVASRMGTINSLHNRAQALQSTLQANVDTLVNVESLRNDPNVRVYRNETVIEADRKFYSALKEAYRLTRIYEYYTSQSYPPRQDLLLIRLAQYGYPSLDSYITELEDAFDTFERTYGNPDQRMMRLSLKDDILNVPRTTDEGESIPEETRMALFQKALTDPSLLNSKGYITVPFPTSFDKLSPLTTNHKVMYVQAEVVGTNQGDELGRVYLRDRGTGVVKGVDGKMDYMTFMGRTAVVNTFFNGVYAADMQIYRNKRLRDRPLVNTGWDLIVNVSDEYVNMDWRLDDLKDIVIYIYYSDFTTL